MSNTHVFFSSIGNVGTTSLSLSIATALASRSEARIGYLSLNAWDDGTDFSQFPNIYLDDLKSRLTGRMLSNEEDFLTKFTEIIDGKLYMLAGNRNRRMERTYTADEIQYLIERAKATFDLLIIDAGNNLDNALSLVSLMEADEKWLVLTQQSKALKRFNQLHNEILYPIGIQKEALNVCLNQYQERNYLLTNKQVEKELDIEGTYIVPYIENGWIAELENTVPYDVGIVNPKFKEAVENVAKEMAEMSDITIHEFEQRKKFKLFG